MDHEDCSAIDRQGAAGPKAKDAGNYQLVKEAILRHYDISEQTPRQRFRDAVMKKDETLSKFNVHLTDLFLKWIKGCKTVEQLRDLMILEQLVNALQTEVRMWVTERKPMTSAEAAKLADDYLCLRGSRMGVGWARSESSTRRMLWMARRRQCRSLQSRRVSLKVMMLHELLLGKGHPKGRSIVSTVT